LYWLDLGKDEQTIARQAYVNRQPLPDRIQNAPKLLPGLELWLQAVLDLDSDRTDGQIPWSSIARYSEFYDFDATLSEDLFYYVRVLDGVILDRRAKKREAEMQKTKLRKH